jgi:hypothetical protein
MPRPFKVGAASIAVAVLLMGAVGMTMAFQPGPAYLAVQSFTADAQGPNAVKLSASTNADIPKLTDAFIAAQLIVGIAWADLDSGTAVVATIHPMLGRDSHQRPDAWHVHTVQLTGGATAPNDFCLVAVSSTPNAGIQIQGSTFGLVLSRWEMPIVGDTPLTADDIDASVGFTVHTGDTGCATGLGVRVRT